MKLSAKKKNSGFTLVEAIVALVILGGSLVVLLGLLSSIIDRTIRDEKKERAVLLARQVLTAIEISKNPIETMDFEGTMEEVLDKVGLSGNNPPEVPEEAKGEFHGHIQVIDWEIPGVDQKLLRKVTLQVNWSASNLDNITITYFVPSTI